jgi:hypothetical protein
MIGGIVGNEGVYKQKPRVESSLLLTILRFQIINRFNTILGFCSISTGKSHLSPVIAYLILSGSWVKSKIRDDF